MTKGKYLCVYCGASERVDPEYYDIAERFGKLIADHDFNLVYGGGRNGLMGRISNAVITHGTKVVGITTEQLNKREGVQDGLHELHITTTMHNRKMQMSEKADAFVILPGGFGTLDEFFEALTWKQLGLHHKPIIIANLNNYWDPLVALFKHIITTDFAHKEHAEFVHVASSLEEIIEVAKKLLSQTPDDSKCPTE